MNDQSMGDARSKILRVFSYIRELTKLRTPPVSQLSTYQWTLRFSSLPSYPSIQTTTVPDDESDFEGIVLRVRRPEETQCPPPPSNLKEWIENGWERIDGEVRNIDARNKIDANGFTITEHFDQESVRVESFDVWVKKRRDWQVAEKPVREAALVFSDLFKLHGQLQRESERYQLYLADGHLVWNSAIEPVDHPIVLKKVELEFDSSVPEFTIRETDESPELYTNLLRHHELEGGAILACKDRLEETEPHPLANGRTADFLKFFIQRFFQDGQFCESRTETGGTHPLLYRDPVLFLGTRAQGFAEALDKLIDALPTVATLPEALLRIVGVDEKVSPISTRSLAPSEVVVDSERPKIDFLLTKPANKEQERVIEQLEQTGSVLVQGPPGTGKSHTIANVIGHLLASGKTVLVSSHTSKALKVVRDKVAEPLQPLCVSVLGNDLESKSQLEESINGIVSYLSRTDLQSLNKEIEQLSDRRQQVSQMLEKLEVKALDIRKGEYADIVVFGEGIPPSEAARRVCELDAEHGWLPLPLKSGAPIPLTDEELFELLGTDKILSVEDVKCLAEGLPDLSKALSPLELKELTTNLKSVDVPLANRFADHWSHSGQNPESLDLLASNLKKSLEIFTANSWIQRVVEDSKLGKERIQPWLNLIDLVESTNQQIAQRSELILKHGPQLSVEASVELIGSCRDVLEHLRSGKSLNFFSTVFKSSWKTIMTNTKVDEGHPSKIEHFEAILAFMESYQLRKELMRRWERQVSNLEGPKLNEKEPEIQAFSFVHVLKLATNWTASVWEPIEKQLVEQGFNIASAAEKMTLTGISNRSIEQIQALVESVLMPAIDSRRQWVRLRELEAVRDRTLQELKMNNQKISNQSSYLNILISSVEKLIPENYDAGFDRYLGLRSKEVIFQRRNALLQKLSAAAPAWAKAIEERTDLRKSEDHPVNFRTAWNVAQWKQELERRISEDYGKVQNEIQRLKSELNGINAQYVEKLAWRFQHSRTGLKEKQALTGWQQLQNKITKTGRGVRDVQVKREARKTLKDCKNAVPVWIMPLSKVFDSFDLAQTKFDVVLLDEASQSDITALVAFAIAKQVIVVGDNEQVTPHAVGQELGKIQSLIDELLQGIPNRMLYDGKTSVYDLAEQAFGETIRLVEHFRCVPEIIEFSNRLSYNGEIKPLREAASSPFMNHLVAHRVSGAISQNKTNREEATEVAAIVAAMTKLPEYSNASIGVISMVGQEQAILIDSILQRELPTETYSRHKLLCGNASQFQGDERDVIIISMVDTCEAPPLPIRQTEDFKKSFNVAVSRARNQLWVVHSLNPATDLKPGDLRLRLIQHAENPKALTQAIEATQKKADPKSVVFEPMVIKDLMQVGFRVTPQFQVGAYTIDMVVEGSGKRIAVECDGDRYHPPEKLADDIKRQLVLERLGWSFIRIRGSEYFRHREATIKRVINELDKLGIERLGPVESKPVDTKIDSLRQTTLQLAYNIREDWKTKPEQEQKVRQGRWGRKPVTKSMEASAIDGNAALKMEGSSVALTDKETGSKRVRSN
ncbi:MAG: AAA family ATPase [Bdellovibrionaceae bacterium]|nr:AAA family ATPase [Pseudobdellovibrionaceae bacterium]